MCNTNAWNRACYYSFWTLKLKYIKLISVWLVFQFDFLFQIEWKLLSESNMQLPMHIGYNKLCGHSDCDSIGQTSCHSCQFKSGVDVTLSASKPRPKRSSADLDLNEVSSEARQTDGYKVAQAVHKHRRYWSTDGRLRPGEGGRTKATVTPDPWLPPAKNLPRKKISFLCDFCTVAR